MKKLAKSLILFLLPVILFAQDENPPFYNDVQSFKKMDSIYTPAKNAILFIGSSSFTMWRGVQEAFPDFRIINRAFGGSRIIDQLRYIEDVVFPYDPKQVVIYCGENDLADSDTVNGELVFERFKQLFLLIRGKYPKVNVVYVSMKPSPSRQMLLAEMRAGNELIRDFLAARKNTAFVDVYKLMIDDEGKPRAELFLDDNLHMNEKGYAIWQKAIEPYLVN